VHGSHDGTLRYNLRSSYAVDTCSVTRVLPVCGLTSPQASLWVCVVKAWSMKWTEC